MTWNEDLFERTSFSELTEKHLFQIVTSSKLHKWTSIFHLLIYFVWVLRIKHSASSLRNRVTERGGGFAPETKSFSVQAVTRQNMLALNRNLGTYPKHFPQAGVRVEKANGQPPADCTLVQVHKYLMPRLTASWLILFASFVSHYI